MRLLTYRDGGDLRLGQFDSGVVTDIGKADVPAWLARGESSRRAAIRRSGKEVNGGDLQLGPCVYPAGKIACIGLNYRAHARESHMDVPDVPILFSKFPNSLAGDGQLIPLPSLAEQYDYEAELAAVIGTRCRDVSEGQALDYVWGYCNANDLSVRDLQFKTSQWMIGKTFDAFLPIGPHLVSTDEAGDPQAMTVRCWLNGELRQDAHTSDMVFGVAEIVSYLSRHMTLEPGDLIATGTPVGVINGMTGDRRWIRAGDELIVEVGPLGRLTNRTVRA
jgi:2-keto-4-pentenoate hydratase/2-oxohepta-3-ene-1,7-dioic acid hydratase in catechol pathway